MVCTCLQCDAFVVIVLSDEPMQNQGRWLVDRKPVMFIADRPKAASLFWFLGGFRCGVWLFSVLLVRYKNRK